MKTYRNFSALQLLLIGLLFLGLISLGAWSIFNQTRLIVPDMNAYFTSGSFILMSTVGLLFIFTKDEDN